MSKVLKILASLVGAFALILMGTTAATAGPPRNGPSFVLDADGSTLPVAEAATDWSKNTGITVTTGDCTGSNCIHFKVSDFACGMGYPVGGCAYRLDDDSCQVEMSLWVYNRADTRLDELITKHEAGHCLWSYLGQSQSYHLPDSPHALMSSTHSSAPSAKESTLYTLDRKTTQKLVASLP